jgi:hypothetical protein
MRAGAVMAVWKSWRCVRVGDARRPESECCGRCGGACSSDKAVVMSFNLFFQGGKEKRNFRGVECRTRTRTVQSKPLKITFPRCGVVGETLKRGASESQFRTRARTFFACSFAFFTSTQSLSIDRSYPSRTTHYNASTGGLMEEGRRVRS